MEPRWPRHVTRGTEVIYCHHRRAGDEVYDEAGNVICYARLCELGYDSLTCTTQRHREEVSRTAAERAAKYAALASAAALGCVLTSRAMRLLLRTARKG
jgi:hypothetical protein